MIKDRKLRQLEYQKYLDRIVELTKNIDKPSVDEFPAHINTPAKRALYNNVGKNEDLALLIHQNIMTTKQDSFRSHEGKISEVQGAIYEALKEFGIDNIEEVYRIYSIVDAQKSEY